MVSIRAKLIVSFFVFFALCVAISLGSILMLSKLENKITFLEIANNYMTEIQQSRRYEKNFLLYGTNYKEAHDHLLKANDILDTNREAIEAVLGKAHADTMTRYMKDYSDQMVRLGQGAKADIDEAVLRKAGSQMVAFAEEFVVKEKDASSRLFTAMKQIPLIFIVVLLILMIGIFITVTRQLVLSLNRFMEHTKRIGEGNFSPIVYNTRDSDEFAQLAEAINQMVKELDHRHEILVQSHKLRAIGTLVAGVAHELNNPLNNTMLTAAMLKEDLKTLTTDEKTEMIDDIIHETERSQRIVRELLNFARENKTDIKALKIEEIMSDSIRLVANQVRLAKVSISLDFVKDLPPIHGDEQMLKQVFVNLILNAVDVLPPQGAIAISIHKQGKPGFITVDIADNGPGIPEHIQTRIFEPFFTTKSMGKGVGLGLSVSRGIIRKLGGYISFKSSAGKGTTFTVSFPTTDVPSIIMSEKADETE